MGDYPYHLSPGQIFSLLVGDRTYRRMVGAPKILWNEDQALSFVSGYEYPVTFKPGDKIELLGRTVITAQRKTFEDYRSMEWWCSTADGIPEIGLFDATSDD